MTVMSAVVTITMCLWVAQAEEPASPASDTFTVQLRPGEACPVEPPAPRFTVRVTADDLAAVLLLPDVPIQFRLDSQRQATLEALKKMNMGALVDAMGGLLAEQFAGRFDPTADLIVVPVEDGRQISIEATDLQPEPYRGPKYEVVGFLLHDVTEAEFRNTAVRFIQTARQLVDSGDPVYDRTSSGYLRWLAEQEVANIRRNRDQAALDAQEQQAVKQRIADALGIDVGADAETAQAGDWLKETRRFSYIIREGKFIDRLQPLVDRINRELEIAGFAPPSALDRPGIYFDSEIGDVEIVLPKPMLTAFFAEADQFERRMAEDAVISIEAVRLTDRDIISGALASRLNAQIQGVHDPKSGFNRRRVLREVGLNAMLAVANRDLQIRTLEGIAAGTIPEGVSPVQIASPTLPPIIIDPQTTTVGSTFAVGADPIFFDGRQQTYGFSYLGPDGIAHTLTLEVVDSLRETWERIERNLIVHKIQKTDTLTPFSVPVGPDTKTYNGIAALISQENQTLIVATGTGAIEKTEATAGTWLIIEDFEISPIPGSSTTLTEEELEEIETKVLLTMFLRDPNTDVAVKRGLLEAGTGNQLRAMLLAHNAESRYQPIRRGRSSHTYGTVFDERYAETLADERFMKRERNSIITLTFFSSQGNIVVTPGATQLGDANDLTSFTTQLRPNVVTPISSFFTKSGSGVTGSSVLTGAPKGEQTDQAKTMTHLVIRARFPTVGRENADRDEGRFTGYFDLPIRREPASQVDLPFLSSSEHPAERLAKLRIGLMFPVLDPKRVQAPFAGLNPQRFPGDIPSEAWETASTRMLMCRKIISDSPGATDMLASDFGKRFVTEVRSLLEYDEDFFDAPNFALRNMTQWNNPERIALALNNSPGRFALERMVNILDELGEELVPYDYVDNYLAVSPPAGLHYRRIYPLSWNEIVTLRRDVAAHYLRFQEAYGDAFLEAVSSILHLGTYRSKDVCDLTAGPLRGYRDLVLFDQSGSMAADPDLYADAHEMFLFLKAGGYKGRLFEKSTVALEHLPKDVRAVIYRGRDILALANHWSREEW